MRKQNLLSRTKCCSDDKTAKDRCTFLLLQHMSCKWQVYQTIFSFLKMNWYITRINLLTKRV